MNAISEHAQNDMLSGRKYRLAISAKEAKLVRGFVGGTFWGNLAELSVACSSTAQNP